MHGTWTMMKPHDICVRIQPPQNVFLVSLFSSTSQSFSWILYFQHNCETIRHSWNILESIENHWRYFYSRSSRTNNSLAQRRHNPLSLLCLLHPFQLIRKHVARSWRILRSTATCWHVCFLFMTKVANHTINTNDLFSNIEYVSICCNLVEYVYVRSASPTMSRVGQHVGNAGQIQRTMKKSRETLTCVFSMFQFLLCSFLYFAVPTEHYQLGKYWIMLKHIEQ